MWQLMRLFAMCSAILALTSCASSMTVRVQCEPPPLPTTVLQPCPLPEQLADSKMQTVTEALLDDRNPGGLWATCIRLHDQLIALVKYRDQVCPAIQNQNPSADKPWWKF